MTQITLKELLEKLRERGDTGHELNVWEEQQEEKNHFWKVLVDMTLDEDLLVATMKSLADYIVALRESLSDKEAIHDHLLGLGWKIVWCLPRETDITLSLVMPAVDSYFSEKTA